MKKKAKTKLIIVSPKCHQKLVIEKRKTGKSISFLSNDIILAHFEGVSP